LRRLGLRDRGRLLGRGRSRERHLLPYVLLDRLQGRNVLGHLILLDSELLYAAPHGIEIERQRLKPLRRVR
jgi:hypothetical protein